MPLELLDKDTMNSLLWQMWSCIGDAPAATPVKPSAADTVYAFDARGPLGESSGSTALLLDAPGLLGGLPVLLLRSAR
jgi:hypothetical protein